MEHDETALGRAKKAGYPWDVVTIVSERHRKVSVIPAVQAPAVLKEEHRRIEAARHASHIPSMVKNVKGATREQNHVAALGQKHEIAEDFNNDSLDDDHFHTKLTMHLDEAHGQDSFFHTPADKNHHAPHGLHHHGEADPEMLLHIGEYIKPRSAFELPLEDGEHTMIHPIHHVQQPYEEGARERLINSAANTTKESRMKHYAHLNEINDEEGEYHYAGNSLSPTSDSDTDVKTQNSKVYSTIQHIDPVDASRMGSSQESNAVAAKAKLFGGSVERSKVTEAKKEQNIPAKSFHSSTRQDWRLDRLDQKQRNDYGETALQKKADHRDDKAKTLDLLSPDRRARLSNELKAKQMISRSNTDERSASKNEPEVTHRHREHRVGSSSTGKDNAYAATEKLQNNATQITPVAAKNTNPLVKLNSSAVETDTKMKLRVTDGNESTEKSTTIATEKAHTKFKAERAAFLAERRRVFEQSRGIPVVKPSPVVTEHTLTSTQIGGSAVTAKVSAVRDDGSNRVAHVSAFLAERRRVVEAKRQNGRIGQAVMTFKYYKDPVMFPESLDATHKVRRWGRQIFGWDDKLARRLYVEIDGHAEKEKPDLSQIDFPEGSLFKGRIRGWSIDESE